MAVPDAHVLYGDALSAAGRYADAAEAYQKAGNLAFTEGTALRLVAAFARAGKLASEMTVPRFYITKNTLLMPADCLAAKATRETVPWDRPAPPLESLHRRPGAAAALLLSDLE